MILCIDPGLWGCGTAVFSLQGELIRAAYVKNLVSKDVGKGYAAYSGMGQAVRQWYTEKAPFEPKEVIVEHPQIYPGAAKTDLNDLLSVVGAGTAAAACFIASTTTVYPREWKGQVEKEVMTQRIASKLYQNELAAMEKCGKSVLHNVLDAVGIGFWKFDRLNTKVYPGASK